MSYFIVVINKRFMIHFKQCGSDWNRVLHSIGWNYCLPFTASVLLSYVKLCNTMFNVVYSVHFLHKWIDDSIQCKIGSRSSACFFFWSCMVMIRLTCQSATRLTNRAKWGRRVPELIQIGYSLSGRLCHDHVLVFNPSSIVKQANGSASMST